MRFSSLVASLAIGVAAGFAPTAPSKLSTVTTTTSTQLKAKTNILRDVSKAATAAFVAGSIWASPVALVASSLMSPENAPSVTAYAKDKASASGSRVNKDAESLLRDGLPINNKEVS